VVLKDGCCRETVSGWQLNTSGFVRYQVRFYLVTSLTTENPNENYGVSPLTTMASDVWKFLKPEAPGDLAGTQSKEVARTAFFARPLEFEEAF
jgi:hypothetical protein